MVEQQQSRDEGSILDNAIANVSDPATQKSPALATYAADHSEHLRRAVAVIRDSTGTLRITTLLPETAAEPVVMYDSHAALRFAVVERDEAMNLDADVCNQAGAHVLLDLPAEDGSWACCVGKAPAGIRTRLRDHLRNKDRWRRALLIQKDTAYGGLHRCH